MSHNQNKIVYAVVYSESEYIPGDQRSIECPGHGYPAHTVTNTIFKEFKNQTEFEDWIIEETNRKYSAKRFRAFRCEELNIKSELKISYD